MQCSHTGTQVHRYTGTGISTHTHASVSTHGVFTHWYGGYTRAHMCVLLVLLVLLVLFVC
jgi:hypothetical protein